MIICPLCDDVERTGTRLLSNETVNVLLHPDWSCLGHAMIASRRHVENFSELTADEAAAFCETVRRVEDVLLHESRADRAILLKLGIQTPHLHLHIYPVSASLDRESVMAIIDARVRVDEDRGFVDRVRARLERKS